MRKTKTALSIVLILILFVALNDSIIYALANIQTLFRKNNINDLYDGAYKTKSENLERELLEYASKESLNIYEGSSYILAKVALRNIYDIYDYVVVNTETKVKEGDAVINEDGLVGLVSEATKTTAKITLLTGQNKISVKVGDNYGILSEYDRRTNEFIIHNINNYQTIVVGDHVVTSGFQEITANIEVGIVSSVEIKGVEKIVKVKPAVNFDNLNYLLIEDR